MAESVNPSLSIARALGPYLDPYRAYPTPLPDDIGQWHCYTRDGGHSIVVVLARDYRDEGDLTGSLVPAPVKSVLRAGYELRRGYVVVDLPYDPDLGLVTPAEEDEF